MLTPELLKLPLSQESHVNSEILCRSDMTMDKPENAYVQQHSTQVFSFFNGFCNNPELETPAPQPTNGGQPNSPDTISDDKEKPETPTHTPYCRNPDDKPPDNQPSGLNGPGGPGGPRGPNNGPNEQDFLQEFMNLLCGVFTMLNNPRPNPICTKVKEPDAFDAFATDASKVNYAIFFLSSTALNWFEPDILHPNLWNPLA
ncbi:uncharacterized protein ARMOST_08612 [Armillaria ostoyae]|uniref:Uncharacterized protein n=1 Tax=Armillaria ostoyae TaxID=47428 RepID=A0A284R960_ARMOS|nr:uncharacterized protein ARMOST_08612 [Armillaria ostoyae]